MLTVYAQAMEPGPESPATAFCSPAPLCKPPIFRRTLWAAKICDLMLAVSRRYGRADYLPVIAWGQLAVQAARLQVGDTLSLEGRVQSRTYRKVLEDGTAQERVAYEVSAMHLLEPEAAE